MRVFVIVNFQMYGSDAKRVFASEGAAQAHKRMHKNEKGNPIWEFPVEGIIETEGFVYAAGFLDRANDRHRLVGIFGNYSEAKVVVGEQGLIARMEIYNE